MEKFAEVLMHANGYLPQPCDTHLHSCAATNWLHMAFTMSYIPIVSIETVLFWWFANISVWQIRDMCGRNLALTVTSESFLIQQTLASGALIWCPQGHLIIQ